MVDLVSLRENGQMVMPKVGKAHLWWDVVWAGQQMMVVRNTSCCHIKSFGLWLKSWSHLFPLRLKPPYPSCDYLNYADRESPSGSGLGFVPVTGVQEPPDWGQTCVLPQRSSVTSVPWGCQDKDVQNIVGLYLTMQAYTYIRVLLFGRQIFCLFLFLPASPALSALIQANEPGPSFTENWHRHQY